MRITSTPIPAYLCLILGCSSGPAEIEYGPPISEAQTFSLDGGRITVTALPGTRLPVDGISLAELSVDEVPSLIRDAASASLPIVVAVNLGPDGAEFSPPLLLSALIDTPTDARGFAVAALTTDGGRPESLPASAEPVDEDTLRADVDVAHFSVVAVQMGPSAEPGARPVRRSRRSTRAGSAPLARRRADPPAESKLRVHVERAPRRHIDDDARWADVFWRRRDGRPVSVSRHSTPGGDRTPNPGQ